MLVIVRDGDIPEQILKSSLADIRLADRVVFTKILGDRLPFMRQVMVAERARPLSGGVRQRDELRRDVACRAVGRIIECGQILFDRATSVIRIDILVPLRARDRTRSRTSGVYIESLFRENAARSGRLRVTFPHKSPVPVCRSCSA